MSDSLNWWREKTEYYANEYKITPHTLIQQFEEVKFQLIKNSMRIRTNDHAPYRGNRERERTELRK